VHPKPKNALIHSESQQPAEILNASITNIQKAVAKYEDVHENIKTENDKVLITGDDILIEYTERLMNALKQINEASLKQHWRSNLDKFLSHYVWHCSDLLTSGMMGGLKPNLWSRMELRLTEMKERRKRLVKYMFKKEGRL